MINGIIGDILGSVYETAQWESRDLDLICVGDPRLDSRIKRMFKNDSFVRKTQSWTDDTVCSFGLLKAYLDRADPKVELSMMCKKNVEAGFSKMFRAWIDNPTPYRSNGNGALMRIGFIQYLPESLSVKKKLAYEYASVSHNCDESFKAVDDYIELCERMRYPKAKDFLRAYLKKEGVAQSVQSYHDEFKFIRNAQTTLSKLWWWYWKAADLEQVLRNCFYIGGDCDTLATIACNLASRLWETPCDLRLFALEKLAVNKEFMRLLDRYELIKE